MATSTTQTQTPAERMLSERAAKIAAVEAETETLAGLVGRSDAASKAARFSAGARKANRTKEIADIETDLLLAGHEVEPYEAPHVRTKYTKRSAGAPTPEQAAEQIEALKALRKTTRFESVQRNIDQRIKALSKAL